MYVQLPPQELNHLLVRGLEGAPAFIDLQLHQLVQFVLTLHVFCKLILQIVAGLFSVLFFWLH